jgi:hypothetical protein
VDVSLQPSVLRERITLEEWCALDEEERGEFVDGTLVQRWQEEVPGTVHEVVVACPREVVRGSPASSDGSQTRLGDSVKSSWRSPESLTRFQAARVPSTSSRLPEAALP